MLIKKMPTLEELDLLYGMGTTIGAGLVAYVGAEMGIEAGEAVEEELNPPPPDPAAKKPKKKSLWKKIWRTVTNTAKAHPIATAVSIAASPFPVLWPYTGAATVYLMYNMYKEWQRQNNKTPLVDEAEKAARAAAGASWRALMRLATYAVVGGVLLAAGLSWWLQRHPEVVVSVTTMIGEVAKKGIDELSEVIDALGSFIPGLASLAGAI